MPKAPEPNDATRFSGLPRERLLEEYGDMFSALPGNALKGENTPANVFGQLLLSPRIASLFFPYWSKSKNALGLSITEQEFIILRSASLFGCDYVWGHHVPVLEEEGMARETIDRICLPIDEQGWSEKEKALLHAADAIFTSASLTNGQWENLKSFYSDSQILDIITVASQYLVFNAVNNVFKIPLENDSMPRLPLD